jgi:hypothetical protein
MFENSKPENSVGLDFSKQNNNDDIPLLDKEPALENSVTTKQSMTIG